MFACQLCKSFRYYSLGMSIVMTGWFVWPCIFAVLIVRLFRFANSKVVHNYSLLLDRYATNSPPLNHAVVKMLYRIAHDCQLMPLFYQLSLFAIYDKILNDPAASSKHMTVREHVFFFLFLSLHHLHHHIHHWQSICVYCVWLVFQFLISNSAI